MYAISSITMRMSKGKETCESVEEKSESVDAPQVPHRNMEEAVLGPYSSARGHHFSRLTHSEFQLPCSLYLSHMLRLYESSSHEFIPRKRRENGRNVNSFRGMASVASSMGWLWTGWISPAPVQMSGMLSVRRAVVIVCGLFRVWSFFSLTSRFFVNSQLDHFRAWIPACSLTSALLHRCFPSKMMMIAFITVEVV